jgi:hypothetical protein
MSAPDPHTRSFLVSLSPERRAIVTVSIEEDHSLPAPLEPEQWIPARATHFEIRAALAALHIAQDISRHEIAWKRQEISERTFPNNGTPLTVTYEKALRKEDSKKETEKFHERVLEIFHAVGIAVFPRKP